MRDVSHRTDAKLPPPMPKALVNVDPGDETDEVPMFPRLAAPMSREDLWAAVELLTRVMGEANRRRVPPEMFARLDMARLIVLGMYTNADDGQHSVRVSE